MDIGAIFITLAVLILTALYVSSPFVHKRRKSAREDHEISSLLAENERIINALQELDFDNSLGKIPAEDYPVMRSALIQNGVGILRQLDENQQAASSQNAESLLEAAILAGQGNSSGIPSVDEAAEDEDLEALIANRRLNRKAKSAGFCPKCGNPILVSDAFCPKCGNPLK
jgi:NADH pyrophosphatase NudC (nudix superfamily)